MRAWLEQAWLIQYLDQQLATQEASWFEAYAMDRPELLRVIDADTRLRAALVAAASTRHRERSVDRGSRSSGIAEARGTDHALAWFAGDTAAAMPDRAGPSAAPHAIEHVVPAAIEFRRPGHSPRRWSLRQIAPAMAATLLAGVGVGALTTLPGRARTVPFVIVNPTRVVFEAMRGEAAPPRVETAGADSAYVLIEMPVPRDASGIELNIGDRSPMALIRSADGVVAFLADRKVLAATPDANVTFVASGRTQKRPVVLPSRRSSK